MSASGSTSIATQGGLEEAGAEQRIVAIAAARLAHEASAVLQSQAKLVDHVQRTAVAALTRIAHGGGTAAEILSDVSREITLLHDLVSAMHGADAEAEFCRPDIILDHVVAGASLRAAKHGVTIDYIRSFSNFTMFGAPGALSALMGRCIDAAARHCGGGALIIRANFSDAPDGRRMLRLVISADGRGIDMPNAAVNALAQMANGASVAVRDGAMIVMLRAPLAAPVRLLSAQADVEAQAG
jgi:hypothetical protein